MGKCHDLEALNESLRAEADGLLRDGGLREILAEFGPVHIVGSYSTNLMAWRDLDIFLEATGLSEDSFFELGRRIARALSPFKMFYTNYSHGASDFGFCGMYWGIRLGDARHGAWKIDLHAEPRDRCLEAVRSSESLLARLDNEARCRILLIKSEVWFHPEYRKSITSQDIYDAVLDRGVSTAEEFLTHMGTAQHRGMWS